MNNAPISRGFKPGHASVPWNRGLRTPTELITPAEVAKILAQCSKLSGSGLRNRALLLVMWRAGLRVAEALALEVRDVDTAQCTLHVRHGKGNKRRYVSIDRSSMDAIARFIAARATFKSLSLISHVFTTHQGKPLRTSYVRQLIARLATQAGIERRVHPHALRHAFAVELLYEATPLNMIQAQLGHSNLATTSRYLAHVSPRDLNAVMQRRVMPAPVAGVL